MLTAPPEHSRGHLVDFELDADTGLITAITIGDQPLPAEALIGVGRYATVVVDPQ